MSALRFRAQQAIVVVLATPRDLDTAIATHCAAVEDAALESEANLLLQQRVEPSVVSVEQLAQEKPIVRLVNNLLLNGVQRRASDIHLHPREYIAEVRYRMDGSLVSVGGMVRLAAQALSLARAGVASLTDVFRARSD